MNNCFDLHAFNVGNYRRMIGARTLIGRMSTYVVGTHSTSAYHGAPPKRRPQKIKPSDPKIILVKPIYLIILWLLRCVCIYVVRTKTPVLAMPRKNMHKYAK